MNKKSLFFSLSLLVIAPLVAADKKEDLATEVKKAEAVKEDQNKVAEGTEEAVLKELSLFPVAHVALMKAAFLAKSNEAIEITGYKHKFTFQKRIMSGSLEEFIRIHSLLKARIDTLTVPFDAESKDIPNLNTFNDPVDKAHEYLTSISGWWRGKVYEQYDVCPKESCKTHEYRAWLNRYSYYDGKESYDIQGGTVVSKDLYNYLDQKLKENPKFLDDRIYNK